MIVTRLFTYSLVILLAVHSSLINAAITHTLQPVVDEKLPRANAVGDSAGPECKNRDLKGIIEQVFVFNFKLTFSNYKLV